MGVCVKKGLVYDIMLETVTTVSCQISGTAGGSDLNVAYDLRLRHTVQWIVKWKSEWCCKFKLNQLYSSVNKSHFIGVP